MSLSAKILCFIEKNTWLYFQNIILLIFFLSQSLLFAGSETLKFKRLFIDETISDVGISRVFQDTKGFIWFGSFHGLYRFDGYSVTEYLNDPKNSFSISGNSITAIFEDSKRRLWIGTQSEGLNLFNRRKNAFIKFRHNPQNNHSISSNSITSLCEDFNGNLWIGTIDGGLNKLIRKQNNEITGDSISFTHYKNNPGDTSLVSEYWINAISPDSSEVLWIGTFGQGLIKFDIKAEKFKRYNGISSPHIFSVIDDSYGNLWMGTAVGGLNKFNKKSESFVHYMHEPGNLNTISHNRVLSVFVGPLGNIWAGTYGGGLNRFNPENKDFTNYKNDTKNSLSIIGDVVWSVNTDKAGALWVGTLSGICKAELMQENFNEYIDISSISPLFNDIKISSLYEDHAEQLWIGTEKKGVVKIESNTTKFTHYYNKSDNPSSLSNNMVYSIIEDYKGIVWIGTFQGLNKLDQKSGAFKRYLPDRKKKDGIKNQRILSLFEDSFNDLWIGTAYGLYKYDRNKDIFIRFLVNPEENLSFKDNAVWSIFEDSQGGFWTLNVNGGGMSLFNRDTKTFKTFRHNSQSQNSLSSNIVLTMFESNQNQLWVGTDLGLNLMDRPKKKFTRFRKADGLVGDIVTGIVEDNNGNLWISTNKGLSKFNPQKNVFKNFDKSDGLAERSITIVQGVKQGYFIAYGEKKINIFHPDSITENTTIPPIVLTKFEKYNNDEFEGKMITDRGISEIEQLDLTYKDNILSFEFVALNFKSSLKNQYSYRLDGFNKNWIHLGTQRQVTFTNLDPGEYILRVKASNNDGYWNEEGTSLKLIIHPPWYNTNLAYIVYILFIGSALYGARKYELNRVQLRNESVHLKEVDKLKSHFFANISHEFRTPLTLILGPIQKLIENKPLPEDKKQFNLIQRNALRLQRLINQLLDLSRLEAGKLQLRAVELDIIKLSKTFVATFESHAERRNIKLSFTSALQVQNIFLDFDKYEKIITNLLSNAFKFSDDGTEILMSLDKLDTEEGLFNNGCVSISIKDQGIGIVPDNESRIFERFYQVDASETRGYEGSGIGLALVKELVELHHGTISLKSEPGSGSIFSVCLPLGKEHLSDNEIVDMPLDEVKMDTKSLPISTTDQEAISDVFNGTEHNMPLLLIVEDNKDVRQYIGGFLEKEYKLLFAENGKAGFKKAFKHIPDIIVSDVMMPEMDGFEMCTQLKMDTRTSHIPVILLTARAGQESKLQGLETGADDYLIKPFDAKELQVRVHNLVEQRRLLQEKLNLLSTFNPQKLDMNEIDRSFLGNAIHVIGENINDVSFSTDIFASKMALSRSQLFRKIKSLTGKSTTEFIRHIRLQHAADLLKKKQGNVSEVAFEVGFNNLSYFTESFKKQFGILPSDYVKE